MSLYLTSLSPSKKNKIDKIKLDKTKDTFIDFIFANTVELGNFEEIEKHLTQASVRLKDRLDRISIILKQKKEELSKIVSIINSIITEYYHLELAKHSNQPQDILIEQTKQIILIKEHEIEIYTHMKNRLIDFNIRIKHRIETEFQYEQKTQMQHSSYLILENTIMRDCMKQDEMHKSLTKEIKASKRAYTKEWRSKTARYEKGQIALEEKKDELEQQRQKYTSLLYQHQKMRSVYKNIMECNDRLMNECKQYKREYYKNKMKIIIINLVLSTKQLSEIVQKIKNEQSNRNQMINEFLYMNQYISQQYDQSAKYDIALKNIEKGIIAKNKNEFYLSNDYSDKRVLNGEISKNKKTFANSQLRLQCIQKEAFIENIIGYLLTIKKKLVLNSIYKHDFAYSIQISIIGEEVNNIPLKAILDYYIYNSKKILKLFSSIAYNILIASYTSFNSIILNNHHQFYKQAIVSFSNDKIASLYEQSLLIVPTVITKPRMPNIKKPYMISGYITQSNSSSNSHLNNYNSNNNYNNIPALERGNNKNNHIHLLQNFKDYSEAKKDNSTNKLMSKYPKQTSNALSPFYWELSSDPTLASSHSTKNISSARIRTAGFRKRMAYDPFRARRNISNEHLKLQTHSLFKSENDVNNENSYEESNKNSQKDAKPNNDRLKQRWYLDDSERGKINLRIKELYKFEIENSNQRKKSNELLLESYQNRKISSNNRRFKVKSAYAIKNLNAYPERFNFTYSAMPFKGIKGSDSTFKSTSKYNSYKESNTMSQNKLSSKNSTPRISRSDFFHKKINFGVLKQF